MKHDKPNTAGITIGLPNSMISKDKYNHIPSASVIMCDIDCQKLLKNAAIPSIQNDSNSTQDNTESKINIESTKQTNPAQPFIYQDSNITAKEVANDDNTTRLIIESKASLLDYQGNTADTLMAGVSGIFASMAELAKRYGIDDSIKRARKSILGVKGRTLANVLFQAEGASVSLTYNYGNNGNDMLKAGVSVGIELFAGWSAGVVATTLIPVSAPILVFVGISAITAVGISLLLNTQSGKDFVNFISDDIINPLIDSIESKLHSFFSIFDSNPSKYELVSNPRLESNDYKSLIELLLDSKSNALDIDTLLHTFPNYLAYPTNTKDSTSQELTSISNAIPMHITAQLFNHQNKPLSNREIYVYSPNFYAFVDR